MIIAASQSDHLPPAISPTRGGARPGSGRKPKTDQNDAYTRLAKAKADHEEHRAKLAELELKRQTRELLPADEVATAWADQIAIAKGRLLSLPSRVSGEVLRLRTQREIEDVIKTALITILEELSGTPGHP